MSPSGLLHPPPPLLPPPLLPSRLLCGLCALGAPPSPPTPDALTFTSLPGLARLLPRGDFSTMRVGVTLGVPPAYAAGVDTAAVAAVFPYGTVTVAVTPGGLATPSGVVLREQLDAPGDDTAVVVVAAVHVRGPAAAVGGEAGGGDTPR